MPLVLPIHKPSAVVGAVYGHFLEQDRRVLVVANINGLIFYDSDFNLRLHQVPVASPINSIGKIKTSRLEAIILCLANKSVYIVQYDPETNSFAATSSFTVKSPTTILDYLCTSPDGSTALIRTCPSQILVLRSSSSSRGDVYGGRWGRVFDACFLGDKVCMLVADPATTPQLGIYTLKSKGFILESNIALVDLDTDGILRMAPFEDFVLIYSLDKVYRYSIDGESQLVSTATTLCITPTEKGLVVTEQNGQLSLYDHHKNVLRNIGTIDSPPSNICSMEDLAFCWGNGSSAQVISLSDASLERSFPALGPIMEIITSRANSSLKIHLLSSSTFDMEVYDTCFCTLSTLDFVTPATLLASVSVDISPQHLITFEDTLIVSSPGNSTVLRITSQGASQTDSFGFYDLNEMTIAGNAGIQITPKALRTQAKVLEQNIERGAIGKHVAVSQGSTLTLYTTDLEEVSTEDLGSPVTLLRYADNDRLIVGTLESVRFEDEIITHGGVSDATTFAGYTVLGCPNGDICFYKSGDLVKKVSVLKCPVMLYHFKDSLVAIAEKTLLIDSNLGYERLNFENNVTLFSWLMGSMVFTTRKGALDLWSIEPSDTASTHIVTAGTSDPLDAMLKHGDDIITACRDNASSEICHFFRWSPGLDTAEKFYSLKRQDQIISQVLVVSFTGFDGLLVSLYHTQKDECSLALIDIKNLEKEPNEIIVGTGIIPKMAVNDEQKNPNTCEVYLLNDNFFALLTITKDGTEVSLSKKEIKSGTDFDIYDGKAILMDFFKKAELCNLKGKELTHVAWLDDTYETTDALILPPTSTYPHTSYLVATRKLDLCQFDDNDGKVFNNSFEIGGEVTFMTRVSNSPAEPAEIPYVVDALLGTSHGGVYAYIRLPQQDEEQLTALARKVSEESAFLCSTEKEETGLIDWQLIQNLAPERLESLAVELSVDVSVVGRVKESLNAFMY